MKVIVIGAGPAGMFAAVRAAHRGAAVSLLEKNNVLGKKMRITGKGRCNITNAGDDILDNIITNRRFLHSCLNGFSNYDAIDFFESIGVKTKVERGMRVFPENDDASSVVSALERYIKGLGIKIIRARAVNILTENGSACGVETKEGRLYADSVVLATGGITYPITGSTGDGHKMARKLGHTVTPLLPSLVPFCVRERFCGELSGLTLKNIGFKVINDDGVLYEDFGELLFTHFGISGPVVLSASCHIKEAAGCKAVIDLKPALSDEDLDKRILRDLTQYAKKDFINSLDDLLPKKLIQTIISLSGIDERKKSGQVTRAQRTHLRDLIKNFTMEITSLRPVEEAIITSGGIDVSQINPKTMESRLLPGLYFAGEIIDCDAYTGGYNLQIAYSTGYAAGNSVKALDDCKGLPN